LKESGNDKTGMLCGGERKEETGVKSEVVERGPDVLSFSRNARASAFGAK